MDKTTNVRDLTDYATRLGITVKRAAKGAAVPKGAIAWYSPVEETIYIKSKIGRAFVRTYILAHEIGHVINLRKSPDVDRHMGMVRLFNLCGELGVHFPVEVKRHMLAYEREAFETGEEILKELEIPIDHVEAKRLRGISLAGYRKILTLSN